MTHAETRSTVFPARAFGAPASLDALASRAPSELLALYRDARVPRLQEVTGQLRGRLLAVPRLPPRIARVVDRLASSDRFPWRGKTFTHDDDERGDGVNRVFVDRAELFRFTTSIGRSRAGDFDAVQLDYDHPQNPFFIRAIKDEIREVAPGLFLGQAYVTVRGVPYLALYFALEHPAR